MICCGVTAAFSGSKCKSGLLTAMPVKSFYVTGAKGLLDFSTWPETPLKGWKKRKMKAKVMFL